MNGEGLFPGYIPRREEQQILREIELVRGNYQSRSVLLYGSGGTGKTWLVRNLAAANAGGSGIIWTDPIDIDDAEFWLLSNLERRVARVLDPDNYYFGPYFEHLSRLPAYTQPRIGYETIVSHLGRIKRIFAECYSKFIEGTGSTVVIVFDTVEAIRGMHLPLMLTQWMKTLPATLFILSGRPHYDPSGQDPFLSELQNPYQQLPVSTVYLGEFTQEAALSYLNSSGTAAGLTDEEKRKLTHLTRGHPLWLAFTVDYLTSTGFPEEASNTTLAELQRQVPYGGEMTREGLNLHEAFMRRLVAPYRETDFWHEALKRLAVVREGINEQIWRRLMSDRPLPAGVADLSRAWEQLLQIPWIRPRANLRYVTLHDAVAEELALRIIPVHDQDLRWRRDLWKQAEGVYAELSQQRAAELGLKLAALDQELQAWGPKPLQPGIVDRSTAGEENEFIQAATELDAQQRELSQIKTIWLYYELLCDFPEGCRQFVELMKQASYEHDILQRELLVFEMQRFLPGGIEAYALGDVIGEAISDFRQWLTSSEGQGSHLEIGLSMAEYLINAEQPDTALALLDNLPDVRSRPDQQYRLNILRGNACERIPGRVKDSLQHFLQALDDAVELESPDRLRLIAQAYKELGFYYRNVGQWQLAYNAYEQARNAISATLSASSPEEDRAEMSSIQTNWAYVMSLAGHYGDATNLIESAIDVRRRLGRYQDEGISWSICGEVYRYERRFQRAWAAYAEAERIFEGEHNWPWLALVYQEQAICLFQAAQEGINLAPGQDAFERAERLIVVALDLCHDQAVRGYPSALNRAGRIIGRRDVDRGLAYLEEGIEWAQRLSDGWFRFANLIEYADLCYRAWVQTGLPEYLERIAARETEIAQVILEYDFPDLEGRWNLLQGHIALGSSLGTGDQSRLDAALKHYTVGFSFLAKGYVGSSGAAAIPQELRILKENIWRLNSDIRAKWQEEFRRSWSQESGSTMLLARLEELY